MIVATKYRVFHPSVEGLTEGKTLLNNPVCEWCKYRTIEICAYKSFLIWPMTLILIAWVSTPRKHLFIIIWLVKVKTNRCTYTCRAWGLKQGVSCDTRFCYMLPCRFPLAVQLPFSPAQTSNVRGLISLRMQVISTISVQYSNASYPSLSIWKTW